jgi:lysyl-tRNA synthetase class 2
MESEQEHWRPSAAAAALQARARLLGKVRGFFAARQVLEVETPVLSRSGNSDPGLAQLRLADTGAWLRTSPEYPMKRLLAAGSGDIYELGRVFRAGEAGRHHNPEFTMLEWYRVGWSWRQLMGEVADLVRHCAAGRDLAERRLGYRDLFLEHTGLDPFEATAKDLARYAAAAGLDAPELDRNEWLDLIIGTVIQPALPDHTLTCVYDYPADQAALAKIRNDSPPVAERFEVFLGQVELANGYQELTDAAEQRQRFVDENRLRAARGEQTAPLDEALLAALDAGLPECAGVALGVDRLLMFLENVNALHEVIAFPADRA